MLHNTPKLLLLLIICTLSVSYINSQESIALATQQFYYPTSSENFEEGLFGIVLAETSQMEALDEEILLYSRSSFELDETRSIDLLLESIARTNDDSEKNDIRLSIGNKYFDRKEFKLARKFYSEIDHTYLEDNNDQSVNFKLGYIALLDKDFQSSEKYFDKVTSRQGSYTKDGYYYSGINKYYLNKVEEAVKSFEKVENEARYKELIPYYLTQIYFKDQRYDEVIQYCENKLSQPRLKNKAQINKMLGLSYLAKNNERKALDYLDAYASETQKLTENEFYQLGYLHYKHGDKMKSVGYLKQLAHQDSEIGQMANYLLGSISISNGNKQEARSAFKQSSKLSYYEDIQSESNYLYYKLAADLGEERTAITGLSELKQSDPYYQEGQQLLSDILVRSSDHAVALTTIENLPQKTPELIKAYQNLSYDYGLQLLENGEERDALIHLKVAADTPGNQQLSNQANFWTGYLLDQEGSYTESAKYINKYLESGDKKYGFQSNYLLAYQAIKAERFDDSKNYLETSIRDFTPSAEDGALFNDAVTRLADLELVDNNYETSLKYYDLAIQNDADDADYITYQKALIYGVNGRPYDKLTTLETLIKDYPKSSYRDDAFFEIGESFVLLQKNNEAYKVFESITEIYPNSEYAPKSWMRRGLISYNQGDMEAALVAYEKGLKTSENNEDQREALVAIEEIYLNELNNPDAYFSFLENEIGFKYEDITKDSIAFKTGYEAYKDGTYETAISLFDSYQKKYKDGFFIDDAYYFEAESYVLLKSYGRGLENYEEVLKSKGSEYYDFALKKAALISYNHEQDFPKAYQYYDEYMTKSGNNSLEYVEAALNCAFISQNDTGVLKYAPLLIENKKATDESKGTAYFYSGKTYQKQGLLDKAIPAYNEVGKLVKNNQASEASYLVSKIFYDRQQYDNAEAQAFETTRRAVNYPIWVARSLILIGDIYREKSDYLNSSAAYESVIENFKDNVDINTQAQQKLEELNKLIESESRVKESSSLEFIETDPKQN